VVTKVLTLMNCFLWHNYGKGIYEKSLFRLMLGRYLKQAMNTSTSLQFTFQLLLAIWCHTINYETMSLEHLEGIPASAAWIMLTSLPPSPTAAVRLPVCNWMRRTTSAFCVGEQRQHTTAGQPQASSKNSCW